MRRPMRIALRFIALAAFVIALAMVFAPSPAVNSPYLSALSTVGLGDSALAGPCLREICSTTLPFTCVSGRPLSHCVVSNGGSSCKATAC